MRQKKGVSPVIGEVLLIVIVIALGLSYFVWTRSYTSNIGGQGEQAVSCEEIKLSIADVCYSGDENARTIKFNVRNNAEAKISNFSLVLDYSGGTENVICNGDCSLNSKAFNTLESKQTDFSVFQNKKEMSIIPVIKSTKAFFECQDKKTIKAWEEIKECTEEEFVGIICYLSGEQICVNPGITNKEGECIGSSYKSRGTDCTLPIETCDGTGNCIGWAGAGCGCPFGYTGKFVRNGHYYFYETYCKNEDTEGNSYRGADEESERAYLENHKPMCSTRKCQTYFFGICFKWAQSTQNSWWGLKP